MIKNGGYRMGGNYTYYRERGWSPLGALYMRTSTPMFILICAAIGILVGLVLARSL